MFKQQAYRKYQWFLETLEEDKKKVEDLMSDKMSPEYVLKIIIIEFCFR